MLTRRKDGDNIISKICQLVEGESGFHRLLFRERARFAESVCIAKKPQPLPRAVRSVLIVKLKAISSAVSSPLQDLKAAAVF